MIRPVVLATIVTALCGSSAWSDGRFRNLMPYGEAREMLQRLGYQPYFMPGAEVCDPNDPRCYPELESCARSRSFACSYTWRRGRSIIEIGTQYDSPVVTRSNCIVNCGKRFDPPRSSLPLSSVSAQADED